ncbi:MAG: DUF4097 family beta strand repeat protein [Clostridia bacterium]|nr:DUF4097 family beta strand repeat protein [Clostridia bacterium]
MSKKIKAWLIIGASLILVGCIIFGGVMSVLKWDFKKLSTVKLETNNYEEAQEFNSILIETNTADITFKRSDDGVCRVTCYEETKLKHSVSVTDGSLEIKLEDTRKWYDHIGFFAFSSPKITVSLPKTEYADLVIRASTGKVEIPKDFKFENVETTVSTGDVNFLASASEGVKIKTSTGDINIGDMSAESLELSVSTGKITANGIACNGEFKVGVSTGRARLTDITCKSITSSGNTGDIFLENVLVTEKLSIRRSTGDVSLVKCDAAELWIKTDTGDVKGSLLSEKVFITQSDTGSIKVPKTTNGGKCEITTDTGDIKIEIE